VKTALLALPSALALVACSGQPVLPGTTEPIVVHGATFIAGPLPGSPPLDGGTPASPAVTSVASSANAFVPGQAGASYSGDVTDDASSVAVRFPDYGTGYWVFVPGAPDLNDPGNLTWSMTFDLGYEVPTGLTTLRFAALDPTGKAGNQTDQQACIDSIIPDNYNACFVSHKPPAAVLSLSWDAPVDLDIGLMTPLGTVLSPKRPTTAPLGDGGASPNDGVLDRDSDANCVPDHVNREDVVWKDTPVSGTYVAYADLFSACGQPAVRFTMSLWVAEPTDGGQHLVQKQTQSGELVAIQADGGGSLGLYVMNFTFPIP
jgi:hypothetical protein